MEREFYGQETRNKDRERIDGEKKILFFQMSKSEDDDNFGVFEFGDILTELQINLDAEEDDEEDAFRRSIE